MTTQTHKCTQEERIRSLETGQTETRVYVKQIREDIQEIKSTLRDMQPVQAGRTQSEQGKLWVTVVTELIKLTALCVGILGAIVGAIRLLGR